MRIHVHPADDHAVGHYRLIWPAQQAAHELDVHVLHGDPGLHYDATYATGSGEPMALVGDLPDVVVLQRPLRWATLQLVDLFQRAGVAVVVEVDDDFDAIDERNVAYIASLPRWFDETEYEGLRRRRPGVVADEVRLRPHDRTRWFHVADETSRVSRTWLRKICRRADLVVCSTPALAGLYGAHGRVRVLENCVPARYLSVGAAANVAPTVGWSGLLTTHEGDLDVVGGGVAAALADGPWRWRSVGSPGAHRVLGVPEDRAEWVAPLPLLDGYPEAVAGLDVAVAPLADSRFNRAKSWLRPLEASALGVAWVGSPLPEYERLHAMGAGLLAASPAAWEVQVGRLLGDEGFRVEQVEAAREAVLGLTYEQQAWRWAEAWVDAHARRHETRSAA